DDNTFMDFPGRLQHLLTSSKPGLDTESIVYPQYETRGDLNKAVDLFCTWLELKVKECEEKINSLDKKSNVWICLIGHSMGGILAAETILKYASQKDPIPPKIIGLFAFDTPYYGVHERVFSKATLERVSSVAQQVSSTYSLLSTVATAAGVMTNAATKKTPATTATATKSSSYLGLGTWGLAALAGAALVGGAVYMQKDNVSKGVEWLGSHLEFVGILWKPEELKQRLENLIKIPDLTFHCFYTQIPPNETFYSPRTFIVLPPPEMLSYFSSTICVSKDEIEAHCYMFDPEQNHYYFDLGHVCAKRIINMVDKWEEKSK
ncbi:2021_t:CDS:2, partial [Dentiscutata heterogama]